MKDLCLDVGGLPTTMLFEVGLQHLYSLERHPQALISSITAPWKPNMVMVSISLRAVDGVPI